MSTSDKSTVFTQINPGTKYTVNIYTTSGNTISDVVERVGVTGNVEKGDNVKKVKVN